MGDYGEIANALKPLVDNFAKLTGPMSEELGLLFGDKIRAFRLRNVTTIVDESAKLLEQVNKPVNPVPPRLLLPILDAASLEDNPTLQEMWSGLLASASDQADNMSPSYAETLKALTPIEARSIKVLFDSAVDAPVPTLGFDEAVSFRFASGLGLTVGESIAPVLIIETLERLGLIRRKFDLHRQPTLGGMHGLYMNILGPESSYAQTYGSVQSYRSPQNQEPLPEVIYELAFTSYGIQFMRACHGPLLDHRPDV